MGGWDEEVGIACGGVGEGEAVSVIIEIHIEIKLLLEQTERSIDVSIKLCVFENTRLRMEILLFAIKELAQFYNIVIRTQHTLFCMLGLQEVFCMTYPQRNSQ